MVTYCSSSSCHRIALATAPGAPTPQHRFADPQKLAAGFQLGFSRTGPKTVFCSPPPSWRFGTQSIKPVYTRITGLPGIALSTCGRDQMSFYPFVPHEISVLIELILGHLRYCLTDVPPQPNSLENSTNSGGTIYQCDEYHDPDSGLSR